MRTVGQILREAREDKFYSLEDVEKETKIRKEMLLALELDDYSSLPPPTFVQGFIKNYSRFLGLDSKLLLAIYRREFSIDSHNPYVMDAFSKPVKENHFKLTPSRLLSIGVGVLVIAFFAYLWFQYRSFIGPPKLELTSPQDQISLDSPQLTVEGATEPEIKVLINGTEVKVDETGKFSQLISLPQATNKVEVVATSRLGATSKIERTVYVKK